MVKEEKVRVNSSIRVPQVKVVNSDGQFLGVMETYKAQQLAKDNGMDLVEVNPKIWPPLCKIADYGKLKYEQKKQQQAEKKKHKSAELKSLFLHPNTDKGDVQRLIDQTKQFLTDGHKVSLTIKFRGRELSAKYLGEDKLKWMLQELTSHISSNTPISMNGRDMSTTLSPKS